MAAHRARVEHDAALAAHPGDARRMTWSALIIILAAIAAWHNSFRGQFVFDDLDSIVRSPFVRRLWPLWNGPDGARPLTSLSFSLNYAWSGLETWSYHAVNLVIHTLAALTLFGVVRRTLNREPLRNRFTAAGSFLALFAALIWLVHPLQTESVTYIVQRAESLVGLFYLLTLYCAVRAFESGHARWQVAAVACGILGMCSKAAMVTAPLVVLLYDRAFFSTSFGQALRRRWKLYAGLVASWLVLWWFSFQVTQAVGHAVQPPARFTVWSYALTQPAVILHYLELAIWPANLCLDYGWPAARTAGEILPGAFAVAALLAALIWAWRRSPALGFAGMWFLVTLAPSSSVFPIDDACFEHRMYLPLAALATVFVTAGFLLWQKIFRKADTRQRHHAGTAVLLLIVAALACRTILRNEDYADPVVLWSKATATAPGNPRGHILLGATLEQSGEYDAALLAYRKAAQLDPRDIFYLCALGRKATREGDLAAALSHYRSAEELAPDNPDVLVHIGLTLKSLGRTDDAEAALRAALLRSPTYPGVHHEIGMIMMSRGDYQGAFDEFLWEWRVNPGNPGVHESLGDLFVKLGRYREAASAYRQALALNPDPSRIEEKLAALICTTQVEPSEPKGAAP